MDIEKMLCDEAPAIVEDVARTLGGIERYGRDGAVVLRRRVEALHHELVDAVCERDLTDLLAHVRGVTRERLAVGFTASELQQALSALEDAIRRRAATGLPAYDGPFGLGMVSTALAHASDVLWRTSGAPAAQASPPDPDLTALFHGAESVLARRPARERALAT